MKLHRIQIPPCRPYEINAAQSWLSDMSAVGLHPEQDFIFAGLAFFERGEARRYRYRFDIAKPATMETIEPKVASSFLPNFATATLARGVNTTIGIIAKS